MSGREPVALRVDENDDSLSIEQTAERASLSLDLTPLPRERLRTGARLAQWLLVLISVVLILIALFAWLTYPSADETKALGCRESAETMCNLLDAHHQRTSAWFGNIKDLIQLLVVSLLIPLLATLVGYLFGGQAEQASSSPKDNEGASR